MNNNSYQLFPKKWNSCILPCDCVEAHKKGALWVKGPGAPGRSSTWPKPSISCLCFYLA